MGDRSMVPSYETMIPSGAAGFFPFKLLDHPSATRLREQGLDQEAHRAAVAGVSSGVGSRAS